MAKRPVCARQESNLRPRAPEARALSPELRARGSDQCRGRRRADVLSRSSRPGVGLGSTRAARRRQLDVLGHRRDRLLVDHRGEGLAGDRRRQRSRSCRCSPHRGCGASSGASCRSRSAPRSASTAGPGGSRCCCRCRSSSTASRCSVLDDPGRAGDRARHRRLVRLRRPRGEAARDPLEGLPALGAARARRLARSDAGDALADLGALVLHATCGSGF